MYSNHKMRQCEDIAPGKVACLLVVTVVLLTEVDGFLGLAYLDT